MTESQQTGPARALLPHWVFWLVLAAALAAAVFLLPWKDVWAALAHAGKIPLLTAIAICLAGVPVAALQWWLFLPRQYALPAGRVFEITALTFMARATLPFLAGDASSLGYMVMRCGLAPGVALLMLTLDQLFTGLGKLAMVCLTLAFVALPPLLVTAGATLAALVSGFLVVMLAAALYGRVLHGVAAIFPARIERLIRKFADLTEHLELLRSPSRATGALGLTVLKKVIEIGVTLAVAQSVGIDLTLWDAVLVVTALDLAGVVPGAPAGLGVFEATALFIYHYLGVPAGIAFAAAVLHHAIYLGTDFLYGYGVLLIKAARRKTGTV